MIISPAEAQNVLDMVRTHGKSIIHSLFKDKKCPGRSISAPQIIMGNLQGLNEENRFRGAVFPEECCSFEQMEPYGPLNLRGLHFSEQMAPKSIAAFGRAVVRMVRLNGEEKKCDASGVIGSASGVIVSNEGHLLTARHVLYHNREFRRPHWHWKRFRENLYIFIDGKRIPVKQEHIEWEEEWKDLVLLKIPVLAGRSHLRTAQLPPFPHEIVWFIGFPTNALDVQNRNRFHTIGEVKNLKGGGDGFIQIVTSARTASGYSGGAMINGRGELLGILSFGAGYGLTNQVLDLNDESTSVMRLNMFRAPRGEPEFFMGVVTYLKQEEVAPERWVILHDRLKDELLDAIPSYFTKFKRLTEKEKAKKANIIRRWDELIKGDPAKGK